MNKLIRVFYLIAGLTGLLLLSVPSNAADSIEEIHERGYLLWGSDAQGGAPYIFPDPKAPSKLIGFEVDLADEIAKELGVKARQAQNAWDSLIPAMMRGDSDIAMNGIEITPQRENEVLFSRPYYIYTEQLVVRKDEETVPPFFFKLVELTVGLLPWRYRKAIAMSADKATGRPNVLRSLGGLLK